MMPTPRWTPRRFVAFTVMLSFCLAACGTPKTTTDLRASDDPNRRALPGWPGEKPAVEAPQAAAAPPPAAPAARPGRPGPGGPAAAIVGRLLEVVPVIKPRRDPSHVAPIPAHVFGFNSSITFEVPHEAGFSSPVREERRSLLRALAGLHTPTLRITVPWHEMQSARDAPYDWARMDAFVEDTAVSGLRPMLLINGTPAWAAKVRGTPMTSAPNDPRVSGVFAAAVAERYGRGGSFWETYRATHPGAPVQENLIYEIWNEPNLRGNWCTSTFLDCNPDPRAYAALYRESRAAIHAVDPHAEVITGGLAQIRMAFTGRCRYSTCSPGRFLSEMYETGEVGDVDGVGLHPYPYEPRLTAPVESVQRVRNALREAGVGNTPIYITEIGWNTTRTPDQPAFTEAERHKAIDETADILLKSECNVKLLLYHSYDYPEESGMTPKYPSGIRGTPTEQRLAATVQRLQTTPGPALAAC